MTVQLNPTEREALQLTRALLAGTYTLTAGLKQRADLQLSLRQAALAATLNLIDSTTKRDRDEHLKCLHQSLVALDRLARELAASRERGELPGDWAQDLLNMQGTASAALDRAIDHWGEPDAPR